MPVRPAQSGDLQRQLDVSRSEAASVAQCRKELLALNRELLQVRQLAYGGKGDVALLRSSGKTGLGCTVPAMERVVQLGPCQWVAVLLCLS